MRQRKPRVSKTAVGTYLTLKSGREVQITGFRLNKSNEGTFTVRYTDRLVSGDSYQIPEGEVYSAKISKKFS